jgi:multidrug efflux pump subunit AcrB
MTIIASLSLPLAILGAVIGLNVTGNTINVMTLGGLFLAIGPLVDNAIVVLENTHRHLTMGKSPLQAAADATGELTMPVIVATLALIVVLCPVALTPGVGGFLFQPLTLAVGFAMIASFLLSWTFVPSLCSKMLRGHGPPREYVEPAGTESLHAGSATDEQGPSKVGLFAKIHRRIDAVIHFVNIRYAAILQFALQHRRKVLAGVGGLFIGREFFPQVDAGQITVMVRAPSHLRLDATELRIAEVEEVIAEVIPDAERAMVVSEIGLNNDWSAAYSANAGQQDTVLRIQLKPERTKSAQEYAVILRQKLHDDPRFVDLEFSFDTGGMVTAALNFGASSPIDIQITGGTPDEKIELAGRIRDAVTGIPGAVDVHVLQRNDSPYLVIEVDRQKAATVGLSARDVLMQVVTAMNSSIALTRNFWIDPKSGNQYFVAVQYPDNPNFRIDDLRNVVATGANQRKPISLNSLVTIRPTTEAVEFNHAGLKRVVDVLVNTQDRDIAGVAADVRSRLDKMNLPSGMKAELRGEYARMNESFGSLAIGLVLASILVYLLMVPLMRSFVGPLIIMTTVPLGLIGVFVMLFATNTTLNVQSEMGVIFLVGIVVSQGVLLLDFANQLRKQGRTAHQAIVQAATIRFRPIMMTFLATFLDLLPMAIGVGRGSESLTPLARAVVGGLLTSTALTLIVVPVLYTLLIRDEPAKGA